MPMPDPIKIGRWFSYPDIRITEAVNELIGVVRRHLKQGDGDDDSEAIEGLTKGLSDLRAAHQRLRAEFEKERDLALPRMTIQPGEATDKGT